LDGEQQQSATDVAEAFYLVSYEQDIFEVSFLNDSRALAITDK